MIVNMCRAVGLAAVFAAVLTVSSSSFAGLVGLSVELVTDAVSQPMDVVSAPGDASRIFILSRGGQVRVIREGTLLDDPFLDVSGNISLISERGLLGMAFHPNFRINGHCFVRYNEASGATVVRRFTVAADDPDRVDPSTAITILRIENSAGNHNGGSIAFGPAGYLYISVGDDAHASFAQDISRQLHGKILRIDVDGDDFPTDSSRNYSVPSSNPYVGQFGDDEVWAMGLRNPFRMAFDRATGDLWIGDVGSSSYEEINVQPAGSGRRNYGWPCMEGDHCGPGDDCLCNSSLLTDPVFEYTHDFGCAVTGGRVYRGCAIPSMRGQYFFADFCSGRIWSMELRHGTAHNVQERQHELQSGGSSISQIVAFGEDAAGELYICDLGGEVFKIVPDTPPPDHNGNGVPDPCETVPGDINGDRSVNNQDLLEVLGALGPCNQCAADLNLDGQVDLGDILIVINHWG